MRKVGVEEEFLLVRRTSAALAAQGDQTVAVAERRSDGQYEHELKREQVELGTSPHESLADLGGDLRRLRADLGLAAERSGARLAALATSPLDQVATATPDERYETITSLLGMVGDQLLTCGMHVHVDVGSPEEAVTVLDALRPWLPLLRALSANSPYASGRDTGYASYRSIMWGQLPTSGVVERFGDLAGYHAARTALLDSGAALDDGMIYFDARLSARYPTVEIRVADVCPYAQDAVVIAALARGLVEAAAQDRLPGPQVRAELLRVAHWRAARWGMDGDLLDLATGRPAPAMDLVRRMCDLLDLGADGQAVDQGLSEIERRGTGARLQREAYAQRRSWGDVVDAVVERTTDAQA